jgi:hypothetical protein
MIAVAKQFDGCKAWKDCKDGEKTAMMRGWEWRDGGRAMMARREW